MELHFGKRAKGYLRKQTLRLNFLSKSIQNYLDLFLSVGTKTANIRTNTDHICTNTDYIGCFLSAKYSIDRRGLKLVVFITSKPVSSLPLLLLLLLLLEMGLLQHVMLLCYFNNTLTFGGKVWFLCQPLLYHILCFLQWP